MCTLIAFFVVLMYAFGCPLLQAYNTSTYVRALSIVTPVQVCPHTKLATASAHAVLAAPWRATRIARSLARSSAARLRLRLRLWLRGVWT